MVNLDMSLGGFVSAVQVQVQVHNHATMPLTQLHCHITYTVVHTWFGN